jgi:hypothetical protein
MSSACQHPNSYRSSPVGGGKISHPQVLIIMPSDSQLHQGLAMPSTLSLLDTLYMPSSLAATNDKSAMQSYVRAVRLASLFGTLTLSPLDVPDMSSDLRTNDIISLSDKFWAMHADPIACMDGAATTILTIHFNLCLGTILDLGAQRQELVPLINDLLAFRTKCVNRCLCGVA